MISNRHSMFVCLWGSVLAFVGIILSVIGTCLSILFRRRSTQLPRPVHAGSKPRGRKSAMIFPILSSTSNSLATHLPGGSDNSLSYRRFKATIVVENNTRNHEAGLRQHAVQSSVDSQASNEKGSTPPEISSHMIALINLTPRPKPVSTIKNRRQIIHCLSSPQLTKHRSLSGATDSFMTPNVKLLRKAPSTPFVQPNNNNENSKSDFFQFKDKRRIPTRRRTRPYEAPYFWPPPLPVGHSEQLDRQRA